jgi:hypothetical protein
MMAFINPSSREYKSARPFSKREVEPRERRGVTGRLVLEVARDGIEPPTRGFSVVHLSHSRNTQEQLSLENPTIDALVFTS